MTRSEYHTLRRAAYVAATRAVQQTASDGRSSYGSKSIMDLHASRESCAARRAVPRDHGGSIAVMRAINRRRRVIACIADRNFARSHTPSCVPYYTRQIRAALVHLEA